MSFTALASLDALQALAELPLKRLRLRCIGADLRCTKGLALGLAHARWGISAPFVAVLTDGSLSRLRMRQDCEPGALVGEPFRHAIRLCHECCKDWNS